MYTTERLDANRLRIRASALDITLFANEQVFLDRKSFTEIASFAGLAETVQELAHDGFFGSAEAGIERCILTPDFHRGSGIPVGTVFAAQGFVCPRAVGTDIGCGMRLLATDVTAEELAGLGDRLDQRLRHTFFEGGRAIALSGEQRRAIFLKGPGGLLEEKHASGGIWDYWDEEAQWQDVMRIHRLGCWPGANLFGLADYIGADGQFTYDSQIGSVGGGNHFTELQVVREAADGSSARAWGLKEGTVTIMVHTGSLGFGHMTGKHFADQAKALYPAGAKHPEHGFFPLPVDGPQGEVGRTYLGSMAAAANFAFANRLFIGLMVVRALSEELGRRVSARLVYDAPHNLIWEQDGRFLHRKGACPAGGAEGDVEFPYGHPVIIPGSMGASSFVLRGLGAEEALGSASHGAGRLAPRQETRKGEAGELSALRVVTKVDPRRVRADVAAECLKGLLEEAPSAYKDVGPVIETIRDAGIASPVARVEPVLTIKG
jgi:tRNA-splicing ligase RtcB